MKKELESYLYENIPIAKAMGIQVSQANLDKVVLFAPIVNNINHKKTVFGGSLHAVATLACWCMLYIYLKEQNNHHYQLVIAKSEVDFLLPVASDFYATCLSPENEIWQRFLKILHLKGKARIQLSAEISLEDQLCVNYLGTFVAIGGKLNDSCIHI